MNEQKLQKSIDSFRGISTDRNPIVESNRDPLQLCKYPPGLDFTKTVSGTEYTVRSRFNPATSECLLEIISRAVLGDPNLRLED